MDADFLFSESGIELLEAHGDEGYVIFMGLCSLLWKSEDTKLSLTKFSTHAKRLGREISKVTEVTGYLLTNGIFVKVEDCFTYQPLFDDKQKLIQKQNTYRQNAMAKQWQSNGKAIAQTTAEPLQSQSYEYELEPEPEHEYIKIIDSLTRDTCEVKLVQNGLEREDLPRALELVARDYHKNPHKKRNGGLVFDVTASWVIQEILKEKAQKMRLKRAEAPPNETPEDRKRREVVERMNRKKQVKNEQRTNGRIDN